MVKLLSHSMSRQVIHNQADFFPLEYHLKHQALDLQHVINTRQPIILLSQISSLERDYVDTLERVGVYDTDDFQAAEDQLADFLSLSTNEFENFKNLVHHAIREQSNLPRILLSMPANYALISARIIDDEKYLGILWRGLQIILNCPDTEYWYGIKHQIDLILTKMDHPELIGRIELTDIPQWLDQVTPLATYLSNLSPHAELKDLASYWGLDIQVMTSIGADLVSGSYLIELACQLSE